jgi:hypothetical protein
MRNANAVELKTYLRMRLSDDEIQDMEKAKDVEAHIPGASGHYDPWEDLLREYYHNHQLDLKNKSITYISDAVWSYTQMTIFDLSHN